MGLICLIPFALFVRGVASKAIRLPWTSETIASFMQARLIERLVLGTCARSVAASLNSVDRVQAHHEGYYGGTLVFRPEERRRIVDSLFSIRYIDE
jgi:hypothetical protein